VAWLRARTGLGRTSFAAALRRVFSNEVRSKRVRLNVHSTADRAAAANGAAANTSL